ncbi:hypothetical protein CORC01_07394 [Colletotrichum orchidophilum]|uniref:Uncharacterized protein n=1 Tax=Colletotrichum orchidophilum TaxID=1209926 RepID=A0A1G4B7B6_9PEZI|nr:uncharacterized protein CORC01_07394 [Colletotrichum orchidophilum]OHE97339.1 hypothetical protein CORC01_07394 [Colletotrichum orchidophilum]
MTNSGLEFFPHRYESRTSHVAYRSESWLDFFHGVTDEKRRRRKETPNDTRNAPRMLAFPHRSRCLEQPTVRSRNHRSLTS